MSGAATDQEAAREVFREVVALLEDRGFDYAIGGGLCTHHWTKGATHIGDIDVVVREDDAGEILSSLAAAGYDTTEMDHSWLHKAFKRGVTIDLMFELKNGTRVDDTFLARRKKGEMFGAVVYVMAPEDQVASLAATLARDTMQHWFNVLDIMSNNDLDWDYVVDRSRRVPLRMLSCVYFALDEKVPVASGVTDRLLELVDAADAKRP